MQIYKQEKHTLYQTVVKKTSFKNKYLNNGKSYYLNSVLNLKYKVSAIKMNSLSVLVLLLTIAIYLERIEARTFSKPRDYNQDAIIFEDNDKQVTPSIPKKTTPKQVADNVTPDVDDRFLIEAAKCPNGYAKRGTWCVESGSTEPDPEYD